MSSPQANTNQLSHPVDHAEALNEHYEALNEQLESLAQLRDDLRELTRTLNIFIRQQANPPQANPPQANPPPELKRKVIKTDPPKAFSGDRASLDNFIYQLEKYFHLQKIDDGEDRFAVISLCLSGSALSWWKANESKYTTWNEVKKALLDYFGDHSRADRSHQQMLMLKQHGDVLHYLATLNELNIYVGLSEAELIRIILMGIKPDLRKSMSHYEKERSNPAEWRKRLVEMDLAEFEGQRRDNNNDRWDHGNANRWDHRSGDRESQRDRK